MVAINQERASVLATVGLVGIGANAAALVVAPMLRPDVNPLRSGLSHYAVGPWSGVQSAAFIALGIGSLALAGALWLIASGDLWTRLAAVMLGLASFSVAGLVAFPMGAGGPVTPIGDLHLTAGASATGWQFLAAGALLPGLRSWRYEEQVTRLGFLLLGLSLPGAAALRVAVSRPDLQIPEGLAMRVVIVPLLLWWTLIALTIRRRAANSRGLHDTCLPERS